MPLCIENTTSNNTTAIGPPLELFHIYKLTERPADFDIFDFLSNREIR